MITNRRLHFPLCSGLTEGHIQKAIAPVLVNALQYLFVHHYGSADVDNCR